MCVLLQQICYNKRLQLKSLIFRLLQGAAIFATRIAVSLFSYSISCQELYRYMTEGGERERRGKKEEKKEKEKKQRELSIPFWLGWESFIRIIVCG
mmetsp:Transcript_17455/g.42827  ORF Transcript_17455/g.42827 Transcript_17455/m.42827 type:complete len:96 (-) Transcript_17455:1586-1873(-)